MRLRFALVVITLTNAAFVPSACGRDVDLGGTSDAGADASLGDAADATPLAECDPCLDAVECGAFATCAPVGGADGFCVTLCPHATECDNDDACVVATTTAGAKVSACVPKTNACALAPAPTADGGAPLDRCGELLGPTLPAECHSCSATSTNCQKNGCYGGWWCNTDTRRCQKPPVSCN